MIDQCKCGHTKFYFIGVQTFPSEPFMLKLYNCYHCRTTVSVKADPSQHVKSTQAFYNIHVPDSITPIVRLY